MPTPLGPPIRGRARFIGDRELALYNQLCSFYTVSVNLGPAQGDIAKTARQIRPEPFAVRRISWATTGDTSQQSPAILVVFRRPDHSGAVCAR